MSKEPKPAPITRREALAGIASGAVVGYFSLGGIGCASPFSGAGSTNRGDQFSLLDVSGTHRQIGRTIGRTFRSRIVDALHGQPAFQTCVEAASGEQKERVASLLDAARDRFPNFVEELEGMAAGAGIRFSHLFAWNCRSEIKAGADPCPPGCSTAGFARDGKMVLAHNEDGAGAYLGRMFVVRATPPSGVSFVCLVYPGTLPGNGPGLNARGVVQTTNYIAPCDAADGVPRYFIARSILEAESLEDAIRLATIEGRAFPWHYNLASLPEGRLVSLETWPGKHHLRDVDGINFHTNHLVHREMQGMPERLDYVERSSSSRYDALVRMLDGGDDPGREDLEAALADHSGSPCRVCRHAGDAVPGVTLARAVFESNGVEMTLTEGPPCTGRSEVFTP